MFADPQSITINAVAQSMPRVAMGDSTGKFRKDDGSYDMFIGHTSGRRQRHTIRLNSTKIAEDPLTEGNVTAGASVYLVVDHSNVGFTNAELKLIIDGFLAYLAASSGAKVTQLLGGEA